MLGVRSRLPVLVTVFVAAAGSVSSACSSNPAGRTTSQSSPHGAATSNDLIAFTRRSGDFWMLATVRPDGSDVQEIERIGRTDQVSGAAAEVIGQPDWSPDRTRIAFTCETKSGSGICVSQADGSDPRILTSSSGLDSAVLPDWSPDASTIAFTGVSGHHDDIYMMRSNGSDVHRLTTTTTGAADPQWSPDGRRLLYESLDFDIWVVNADGTDARPLIDTSAREAMPAWSPDGSEIAFAAATTEQRADVYVSDSDGEHPRRITHGTESGEMPAWSVDGSQIAFGCFTKSEADLCIVDADGSHQQTLVGGPLLEMQPAWS